MFVKLLVPRVTNSDSQKPGDVIEVPDDEAARMLADQQCIQIEGGGDESGKPAAGGGKGKQSAGGGKGSPKS